jgi:hypothetical protein
MKRLFYLAIGLFLLGIGSGCKKSDETQINNNYTYLHDTLIQASAYPVNWAQDTFNLDIDKDTIIDLSILVSTYYSSFAGTENYIQIIPKNEYEISFSTIIDTIWSLSTNIQDTVFHFNTLIIPREYKLGDMIKISDEFTNGALMIAYARSYGYPTGYNSGEYYGWMNGYKYIALRRLNGSLTKLAWLKINVTGSSQATLNSCNYTENKNEWLIE